MCRFAAPCGFARRYGRRDFLNDAVGPELTQQGVFVDQVPLILDQQQQRVERLRCQRDRRAVVQQLLVVGKQNEGAKDVYGDAARWTYAYSWVAFYEGPSDFRQKTSRLLQDNADSAGPV